MRHLFKKILETTGRRLEHMSDAEAYDVLLTGRLRPKEREQLVRWLQWQKPIRKLRDDANTAETIEMVVDGLFVVDLVKSHNAQAALDARLSGHPTLRFGV